MNKDKLIFIFFIIWILFISVIIGSALYQTTKQWHHIDDSLNTKIDSIYIIKDSIQEVIDTVYIELQNNDKQYEKDVNCIINNDVNKDYEFFLEYIRNNKTRFDSINNNF